MNRGLRSIVLAVAVAALALIGPAAASAATFTVNTTSDVTESGGCTTNPTCSLRDALSAAALSSDEEDTVVVPAGTYPLSLGPIIVSGGNIVLRGAGARQTIVQGDGANRVLEVTATEPTIEGLTIRGGNASMASSGSFIGDGGGILLNSEGSVTLRGLAVLGNTAALNGAGISAPPESTENPGADLVIEASTVAGNKVEGGLAEGLGGGIYAFGNLEVVNSTVTGNTVESTGVTQGGGLLAGIAPLSTSGTEVILRNSTIAANSVSAGGSGGGIGVENPTPSVQTALAVSNTIVSGNSAAGVASNCVTLAVLNSTNNLSSDESCGFSDAGSKQNADPQLGPLADNGGPTDTMALPASSPAVDAGTNAGCPATDQRGVARPQLARCDIGAFELEPAKTNPPGGGGGGNGGGGGGAKSADLRLTLKAKPKKPVAGKKLTFLLTVADRGPDAADKVVVNGVAPAAAKSIKGRKVAGRKPCKLAKAKKGKRKFSCQLGSLAAGSSVKLKIVIPKASGKLSAKASVSSAVPDPAAKGNSAKATARPKPAR